MKMALQTVRVALDTAPIRNLAEMDEPPCWVEIFERMSADGYLFSLADNACLELINQISKGAIDASKHKRMLSSLSRFIDPELPVVLAGKDIIKIIEGESQGTVPPEILSFSKKCFSDLGCIKKCSNLGRLDTILDEFRNEWKKIFKIYVDKRSELDASFKLNEYNDECLNCIKSFMDNHFSMVPSYSVRYDLWLRYTWRQFVRSKNATTPYNPSARKKRNDGIDFTLLDYLALPALVVTEDKGLLSKMQDISSFQRDWIKDPYVLAKSWRAGERPEPKWPEPI